jgi:hypothetical protein
MYASKTVIYIIYSLYLVTCPITQRQQALLHADFYLVFLFNPDDVSDIFFQK